MERVRGARHESGSEVPADLEVSGGNRSGGGGYDAGENGDDREGHEDEGVFGEHGGDVDACARSSTCGEI